jgi:hypothetical protein
MEYVVRFAAGGAVVSLFAILADILRPKSVAGLLGAAPSVALATLILAFWKHGAAYVSTEARSMVLGSLSLTLYSVCVCQLLMRGKLPAFKATTVALGVWLIAAFALKLALMS